MPTPRSCTADQVGVAWSRRYAPLSNGGGFRPGSQNGLSHLATVAAPPGFVQYDPNGKGNHHRTVDSPAIDRGRWIEAPMSDYDGVARPQGQDVDIGPFEFLP